MSQTEKRSLKEVIPFAGMLALAFFIGGFVTFSLFNGVTGLAFPFAYEHNWTLLVGWVAAFTVVGLLLGLYYGRK